MTNRLPAPLFALALLLVLAASISAGFIRYTWTWAGNGYTVVAERTWSAGDAPTRTIGPAAPVMDQPADQR